MPAQGLTDEALVALLATDSSRYFDLVVIKYQASLLAFVQARIGNHSDAEEIVQESFIRAYKALYDYDSKRIAVLRLKPWLFKIAMNATLNYNTRESPILTQQLSVDIPEVREQVERTIQGQVSSSEMILQGKEAEKELYESIYRLPPVSRDIIFLHYIAGLDYREISEILQMPLNTIKSQGWRAIKQLRKWIVQESPS